MKSPIKLMLPKITFAIIINFILNSYFVHAQESLKNYHLDLTIQGNLTNSNAVPFWMRSNQFGSFPIEGASGSMLINSYKEYDQFKNTSITGFKNAKFDWGYDVELRSNFGANSNLKLIEGVVKGRYGLLEAQLGRSKEVMGLNGDTVLSSGNFAVSGNSLGIPMLNFKIMDYYRIPIFDGLISLKGNFANGYMGKLPINPSEFTIPTSTNNIGTFYHQKSLYGRIGKENWKINLFGGINHQVQFGNEKKIYGEDFDLNTIQSFWKVFWGKPYKNGEILSSKIGNHQGSIDLGFTYDFNNIKIQAYRQNFYDVGAISKLANIRDGLNGLTFTNKIFNKQHKSFQWKTILAEFFYSKDQAGYPWSINTRSGDENYYNNHYYSHGWSYYGDGIGSPLIVPAANARSGQANDPKDFFISNRVISGHLGLSGEIYGTNFITKITGARHFGTFGTSEFGRTTGNLQHSPYKDQFVPVNQFSAYLQAERPFKNNLVLGMAFAFDYGELLPSSTGVQVSIKKSILK